MNISVATVFPDLYTPFINTSLVKRAQEQGICTITLDSLFSFVAPKERIDAPAFGHGAGMLLRPEVIERAVTHAEERHGPAYKIFFSPQGKQLNQKLLTSLAQTFQEKKHIMLLPARYEGMDARVEEEYADLIVSAGDFVLMGGDIPAMMLLEGMLRLIPGVVGKQESVHADSFTGPFVDYPAFTEPVEWHGQMVPDVVRSGNHAALASWRQEQSVSDSVLHHFDWVRSNNLSNEQVTLVREHIPHHYVALMHGDVLVGPEKMEGTTSVTSIDVHDISRSGATYDIAGAFIVTPLEDQQKIVANMLSFWQQGAGIAYNNNRHQAVKNTQLVATIDDVVRAITEREGIAPVIIATAAKTYEHSGLITYFDQKLVWEQKKPVLFVFGTGQGLSPKLLERCDYLLRPIHGFAPFNHLSVRSAVSIVLDRWLGRSVKPEHI